MKIKKRKKRAAARCPLEGVNLAALLGAFVFGMGLILWHSGHPAYLGWMGCKLVNLTKWDKCPKFGGSAVAVVEDPL